MSKLDANRGESKNELRDPPAFQEYGGDLLNLESILTMSLSERGLFATMRWRIWANNSLPSDPKLLAGVLGLSVDDVQKNLTPRVRGFFAPDEEESGRIICPELASQKAKLMKARLARSEGGRIGGAKTQRNIKLDKSDAKALLQSDIQGGLRCDLEGDAQSPEKKRVDLKGRGKTRAEFTDPTVTSSDEVASYRQAFGEQVDTKLEIKI